MSHRQAIESILDEHVHVAKALYTVAADVDRVVRLIADSMAQGGVLVVCGNGGSAADVQHIATELTGGFLRDRKPLPAPALHGNTSSLTAIGNDYGYDEVFPREVSAHGRPGDVLLAISTSGNNRNVIRAIEAAHDTRMVVVGLTGADRGRMRTLCDVCLCVASTSTPRIHECHILVEHTICEPLQRILC
jgi:D-sedoheptulose 7-phosphate isomerase